ncbi:MAG: hypothetical protein MZW92_60385 [Comamonadaceae bacterium]|nr:hypothetical protein [Comamonadaceae bacterium]
MAGVVPACRTLDCRLDLRADRRRRGRGDGASSKALTTSPAYRTTGRARPGWEHTASRCRVGVPSAPASRPCDRLRRGLRGGAGAAHRHGDAAGAMGDGRSVPRGRPPLRRSLGRRTLCRGALMAGDAARATSPRSCVASLRRPAAMTPRPYSRRAMH